MIVILKFRGYNTHNGRMRNYQGVVDVEKDGVTRSVHLPLFRGSASLAISAARQWRKLPGNMERIEAAFDAKTSVRAEEQKNASN